MANADIDAVADIAMDANQQFSDAHKGASTQVGAISNTLRDMNIAADAVSIDDMHSGKRLALIILDQSPGMVGIGIGQKETVGDYELLGQVKLAELEASRIVEILEARFTLQVH
ncbi:MAG: hypothetical protein R3270_02780 [Gammaproteobacteria bacterium]|nr:hypothetical protein [Gammaproteobacteria bacterium]